MVSRYTSMTFVSPLFRSPKSFYILCVSMCTWINEIIKMIHCKMLVAIILYCLYARQQSVNYRPFLYVLLFLTSKKQMTDLKLLLKIPPLFHGMFRQNSIAGKVLFHNHFYVKFTNFCQFLLYFLFLQFFYFFFSQTYNTYFP